VELHGGAPTVSGNSWSNTTDPLTVDYADDLSGVTDDNSASGPDVPADETFELGGSVATDKTLTFAPSTNVLYVSDGIDVEDGGTITTDSGAIVSGGGITIDGGGAGVIGLSAWLGGKTTFDVETDGHLTMDGATISGADEAIDADCEDGPTFVTVTGSTFSGNGFAIGYCNTEETGEPKLQASGNTGLTDENVTTHSDECEYEPPAALVAAAALGDEEAAAAIAELEEDYPAYALMPIWDVFTGPSDAVCDPLYNPETGGYVKLVG
jgi:hypothetical protein